MCHPLHRCVSSGCDSQHRNYPRNPGPSDKDPIELLMHDVLKISSDKRASCALRHRAGWFHKAHPTFADALALVRKELWDKEQTFYGSPAHSITIKVPRAFVECLTEAVCYAA
jgi:hypothetical protein